MTDSLRTVGRYEILRVLGRGGMAVVYLARETDLGRLVALGPSEDYADDVDAALAIARADAHTSLQAARKPADQDAAARKVRDAYEAAHRTLESLAVSPADAVAHGAITEALRRAADGFDDLAGAARRRSTRKYRTARATATRSVRRVDAAIAGLERAGYEVR